MPAFKLLTLNITTNYPQGYGRDNPRTIDGQVEVATGRWAEHSHTLSDFALRSILEIVTADVQLPQEDDELDKVPGLMSPDQLTPLPEQETETETETPAPPPAPKFVDDADDRIPF